jgi:hypothetical protein
MIAVIFLVAALIFFILAAVNVGHPRVNFIGAGFGLLVVRRRNSAPTSRIRSFAIHESCTQRDRRSDSLGARA